MNTFLLPRASAVLPLLLFLSATTCRAAPVQAAPTVDPQALALLQKVQTATQKTHSLTADFTDIYDYHDTGREFRNIGNIRLMKPNYAFEQHWNPRKNKKTGVWEKSPDSMIYASDGKTAWRLSFDEEYQTSKADSHGRNIGGGYTPAFDFFDSSQSVLTQVRRQQAEGRLLGLIYAGKEVWEGRLYQLIDWKWKPGYDLGKTAKKAPGGVVIEHDQLYIGGDSLVHRIVDTYNLGWSIDQMLQNVQVNAPLTAASFKFTLPPGAHLPTPPPPLLAVGTSAPNFAATAPDGSAVHLSDYKGKTVVLDFWSTWCGPCQSSMPHLEKVFQQAKGKNVAVLGVCVWDEKAAYDTWVTAKKDTYHFPTAFDPAGRGPNSIASKLYHVSGIPTQYVIDKDGNIAASTVGYDEGGTFLETALNKLGTDIPIPTAHK